jgi:hypothetical protein
LVAGVLLFAIAIAAWFVMQKDRDIVSRARAPSVSPVSEPDSESSIASRRSSVVAPRSQISSDRVAIAALPPPRDDTGRSMIADDLHAPNRTGMDDLSVVLNLFTHYRARFQGYPVGEDNATFMNALSGNNPGRLAFIDRHHPAIDAQGQLLDRWGEPFFFHLLGRDALEIRSAGPDRELYTADDMLTASPMADKAALTAEN